MRLGLFSPNVRRGWDFSSPSTRSHPVLSPPHCLPRGERCTQLEVRWSLHPTNILRASAESAEGPGARDTSGRAQPPPLGAVTPEPARKTLTSHDAECLHTVTIVMLLFKNIRGARRMGYPVGEMKEASLRTFLVHQALPQKEEGRMKEAEQRDQEVSASYCCCNKFLPGQWLKTMQTCPPPEGQRS